MVIIDHSMRIINEMIDQSNFMEPSYNDESTNLIPEQIIKIVQNFGEWLIGPQGGGN